MPLIIGIENAADKGFSEEEYAFTNGFNLGCICMHAKVGRIGKKVSVDTAVQRFTIVMKVFGWDASKAPFSWLTDAAFVQRMADNDWYCNAGTSSDEEFHHHMRNVAYSQLLDDADVPYGERPQQVSFDDHQSLLNAIRCTIGDSLSGGHYMEENIEALLDKVGEHFELSEPFYDGKYLCWDEDTYSYSLKRTPQEDE